MKIYRGAIEILDVVCDGKEFRDLDTHEHSVSFTFELSNYVDLKKGDRTAYNGKNFYLQKDVIVVKNKETDGYRYELTFYDITRRFDDFIVKFEGDTDFTLNTTGTNHLKLISDNLADEGIGVFNYSVVNDIKEIHYENCTILGALDLIAETYELEWWLEGDTINLGICEFGEPVILEYDVELDDISFSEASEKMITRLYAFGGTRNMLYGKRLTLPPDYLYVDLFPNLPSEQIVEGVKIFDDIYPRQENTITEITSSVIYPTDRDHQETTIYTFKCSGINISQEDLLPGQPLKMAFTSGQLNGREFELIIREDGYEIRYEQEGNDYFPNPTLRPQTGDTFFFFGFRAETVMPELVTNAQNELLSVAQDYMDSLGMDYVFDVKTRSIYCEENNIDLDIGQVVTLESDYLGSITSRIRGYEKDINNVFDATYSIGSYSRYSRISAIEKETGKKVDKDEFIGVRDNVERVSGDIQNMYLTFLSKVNPDTANKIITFLEGLEVGAFSPGLLGSGAAIKNVNGTSVAEVDQLLVRQRAEFFSVLIHEARSVGGQLIISAASMLCTKVEETPNFYRCYFDSKDGEVANLFSTSDFARCQIFTGTRQKFYWRKVVAVGTDYIELSKTDAALNSDIPEVGDTIFQLGSTDVNRQGAMILSTVGNDAPSFIQYSGINSYDLTGKETTKFTRLGNRIVGSTVFLSSGVNLDEWADGTSFDIQDAQSLANQADQKAQQAINDASAAVGLINSEVGRLQSQIDGEVSNWFYPYSPTLDNYPSSEWSDEEKDRHIGDTFTNTQEYIDDAQTPDAGKSWRFVKEGETYKWTPIADSDAVKALLLASEAQGTADGKNTTYLVQPTSYKLGDMWVLNADMTVNGVAYKQGDVLTALQDSTVYNQAHWTKKIRYTDDTAVNNLQIGGRNYVVLKTIQEGYIDYTNGNVVVNSAHRATDFMPVTSGVTYTLSASKSFYYPRFAFYDSNKTFISGYIISGYRVLPYQITPPANAAFIRFSSDINNGAPVNTWKFEKGDKATDYTLSSEDVQAEIDAAVVKATYWSIKASAPVIYKNAPDAITGGTHTSVTVSGELRSGTTTTQGGFITVTPNGGTEPGTATASPVTIAPAAGDGKTSYTVKLYDTASKTTLLDTLTIPVAFKGASGVNAINVILSNEADVLPASPEGVVSDYSGSGTTIRVFEGATELDYDGIGTANGKFNVTATGTGITVGAKSESGLQCVFGNASNMTLDNAMITFTISGKTQDGDSFSVTKTQSFAKARTGQNGVSVTLVDVEFAKNTSATTPPTTGWSTTAPTLLEGEQLWTRTKTTYSSGSPTYTTPTNITPKKGDVGTGIESVTEEYAISTSKTVQPTSGWSTTQPTWVQGQYIWSRVKVVYKNPSSTIYTGYAVSSEWEAVNNLQIGGRNLLRNTNTELHTDNTSGTEQIQLSSFPRTFTFHRNSEYVFSFDLKGSGQIKFVVSYYAYPIAAIASNGAIGSDNGGLLFFDATSEWKRVWVKITTADWVDETYVKPINLFVQPGADIYGNYFQLETGSKATDWSPAPEDVQAEIDDAKQEALTAAGNAQNTADSLKNFTDTAFRDGIIDRSESVAIEKYKNSLNEAMAKAEASYNKVYTNTYLEGAAKTSLLNAKINLWGQRDTLLSAINTAISGGTTTPAQKTAVDNAFNTFNSLMSAFQNALEEANKAIQSKLDQLSTDKVNNIQVGGRNILTTLTTNYVNGYWSADGQQVASSSYIRTKEFYPIEPNKQYIIQSRIACQLTLRGKRTDNTYFTLADRPRNIATPLIFTTPSDIVSFAFYTCKPDLSAITPNFILEALPKLELGNKATDYTPSPEDVQAEIDAVQTSADDAQLAADGYMKARYIRDWIQGSTLSTNNVWREISVIRKDGTNVAQGKTPSSNGTFNASYPAANATDNNINTYAQINGTTPATSNYVRIDLGQVYNDIDYIQIWHDYTDERTFYGTKTEISVDGVTWTTIYDSATMGTYKETIGGKTHSQRRNRIAAEVNRSKAITDKFGTRVDGGLISTVITEYRELDSPQVTGLISGIQGTNKDLPFLVAGGTYNDALAGTAKAIIRHDGSVKFTEAEIQGQLKSNTSGSGIIIDPSDRSLKLTNDSGVVIASLSADLSIPVLVLGDWGGSSSAVHLSDDGLLVRVEGTSESDISFNKMSVFNSTGSIFEASVPYGDPLVVIMKNLPSSSTGLSTGRLWRDSNGFIRIVL